MIGGGDWAEDRLIPDAVRAWGADRSLMVRRPQAVRPWQHVLEPLNGYLMMAERLWDDPHFAPSLNFGPDHQAAASVAGVLEKASMAYGGGEVVYGDGSEGPHEAGYLMLDSTRARQTLGYRPVWDLDETVTRTMAWYRGLAAGGSATSLCLADIGAFDALLEQEYGLKIGGAKGNKTYYSYDGRFKVEVRDPIAHSTPEGMMQALNDDLEVQIRAHPGQWFWVHRRWKKRGR